MNGAGGLLSGNTSVKIEKTLSGVNIWPVAIYLKTAYSTILIHLFVVSRIYFSINVWKNHKHKK